MFVFKFLKTNSSIIILLFLLLAFVRPVVASPECQQGTKEGNGCDCWCLNGAVPQGTEEGAEVTVNNVKGTNEGGRLYYRRDSNCNSPTLCEQECDKLLPANERSGSDGDCRAGALQPAGGGAAPATPQAPVKYEQGAVVTEIENPLGEGVTSIPLVIGRVINTALGISGSIAILMVVYGGITWLTSGGVAAKIDKGKSILVWATIGLAVIFGAYSLVNFVISRVIGI